MTSAEPEQMSIQGFGTYSAEKYELSGNKIRQVKPHHAVAIASWLPETSTNNSIMHRAIFCLEALAQPIDPVVGFL
ncbi:MAG: hypothetical protein ABSC04_10525 [Syntrophobacteraceae bacterium]